MIARIAIFAPVAFAIWAEGSLAQQVVQVPDLQLAADKEMAIGREHLKRNYPVAAINRFKVVITHYRGNSDVPEALGRLAEIYLTLGIASEAQTAAAMLGRNFPDNEWCLRTLDLLKSADLEPREDEGSWISKAFR